MNSLGDAESLTNASFMNESHKHDYWGGKTELLVMDLSTETGSTTIGGQVGFFFRPDPGHVIPQGTDRVTVTMTWADALPGSYGAAELWVRSPHDHDSRKVAAIVSGKPTDLATTLADADVPHQQLSAWRFELHLPPGAIPEVVSYQGTVKVSVLAHRGLDIPVLPPHPDAWNGKDAIILFDDIRPTAVWQGLPPDDWRCFSPGCPSRTHRAANGTIVPFDAKAVEVRLIEDAGALGTIGIRYHAADSWNWTKAKPTRTDGATRIYVLSVSGVQGDGPYAAQSLWEFAPFAETPRDEGEHAGGYHLSARALSGR